MGIAEDGESAAGRRVAVIEGHTVQRGRQVGVAAAISGGQGRGGVQGAGCGQGAEFRDVQGVLKRERERLGVCGLRERGGEAEGGQCGEGEFHPC